MIVVGERTGKATADAVLHRAPQLLMHGLGLRHGSTDVRCMRGAASSSRAKGRGHAQVTSSLIVARSLAASPSVRVAHLAPRDLQLQLDPARGSELQVDDDAVPMFHIYCWVALRQPTININMPSVHCECGVIDGTGSLRRRRAMLVH